MNSNLLNTICLSLLFCVIFTIAEFFYHKRNIKVELTRKFVHASTGLITLSFPFLFTSHWSVLFLAGSFFLILMISMRFNMLPSINAVSRKTWGCVLFPLIIYACFVLYQISGSVMLFYLPILILAICDPVAAMIGIRWPIGEYKTFGKAKTLSGSFGFFLSSMLISIPMLTFSSTLASPLIMLVSISVSSVSAFVEAISHKGYDNATIPASVIAVLLFANYIIF